MTHHLTQDDIRELRSALEAQGAFERRSAGTWLRFGALLAVFAGLSAAALSAPLWLAVPLFPLAALALTIAALYGHEGGHKSLSVRPAENALMLHLAFPLLGGMGALYWSHKHNVGHHGHPNVVGGSKAAAATTASDPDMDLWPMASSKRVYEASGPARRFFQRHLQGVAFWPLTALLVFTMRFESFRFLARHVRRQGADRAFWLDLAALAGHYTFWLVVPSLIVGPLAAGLFYAGIWSLSGIYLSAIFVGAHMGLPLYESTGDPWLLQLRTTRNLHLPRWAAWAMVGLDHQVEHHLFPRMPHGRMPAASPVVAAWAERKGVPYLSLGFGAALVSATRYVAGAWDEEPLTAAEASPRTAPDRRSPDLPAPGPLAPSPLRPAAPSAEEKSPPCHPAM